jgi:hypothetical protein
MSVDCKQCGKTLSKREAGIAICPMGDEIICSYYLCPTCDVWTARRYYDFFHRDESETKVEGPFPRSVGDAWVAKIRTCPDPMDKMCDCPVHQGWR